MLMNEFDRVFDGDDVPFPLAVDLVDHRGECRRFSRACWSCYENETTRLFRHLCNCGRKSQVLECLDRERNLSDDHRHASALPEAVSTETCETGNSKREIELVLHLETLFLRLSQNRVSELERVFRAENAAGMRARDLTIDTELRALARHDVQIGRAESDHLLEKRAQIESHRRRCSSGNRVWRRRFHCPWCLRGFGGSRRLHWCCHDCDLLST